MRTSALRFALVAASAVGLAVAGLPAAYADPHAAAHQGIGDTCLVGTWMDNPGRTTTKWNGTRVVMRGGGGDVDHITKTGIDHDNWMKSKPLVGKYLGHSLTERIRGVNRLWIHAGKVGHHASLTLTERGWTATSTNRYVYRGHHSSGYLNQTGVHVVRYRCSSTTLTLLGPKGHVIGRETRLSDKP